MHIRDHTVLNTDSSGSIDNSDCLNLWLDNVPVKDEMTTLLNFEYNEIL